MPELSHLQFLILGILLGAERRGHEIRDQLAEFGVSKSGPAFYQLMARLEDAGLVEGRYRQEIVEGQIIRERLYKIRARGERAWRASRDFQLAVIDRLGGRLARWVRCVGREWGRAGWGRVRWGSAEGARA